MKLLKLFEGKGKGSWTSLLVLEGAWGHLDSARFASLNLTFFFFYLKTTNKTWMKLFISSDEDWQWFVKVSLPISDL